MTAKVDSEDGNNNLVWMLRHSEQQRTCDAGHRCSLQTQNHPQQQQQQQQQRVICSHYCVSTFHQDCVYALDVKVGSACANKDCLGLVVRMDRIMKDSNKNNKHLLVASSPQQPQQASFLVSPSSMGLLGSSVRRLSASLTPSSSSSHPQPPLLTSPVPSSASSSRPSLSVSASAQLFSRGMSKIKSFSSNITHNIGGSFQHAKKLFVAELGIDERGAEWDHKERVKNLFQMLETYKQQIGILQTKLKEASQVSQDVIEQNNQLHQQMKIKDTEITQILATQLQQRAFRQQQQQEQPPISSSSPLSSATVHTGMFANLTLQELANVEQILHAEQKQRKVCVICLERPSEVLFLPCRHMRVCVSCCDRQPQQPQQEQCCPICRNVIHTKIVPFQ